jgi:hypothetical protein
MALNHFTIRNSNKIIILLLLCFVAVMMTPRGNLAPWSFNNGSGAANSNSTLGENFRTGQELPRPARGIN